MSVDALIDELSEILENSWNLPLSGGRTIVDAEKVHEIIDNIKAHLPNELKQARAIVADRSQIISDAKNEAESIVHAAEEKAQAMLDQSALLAQAKQQASDILLKAQVKSKSIKKAANEYVEDILKSTDDVLAKSLVEFRKARQNIRSSQKN